LEVDLFDILPMSFLITPFRLVEVLFRMICSLD